MTADGPLMIAKVFANTAVDLARVKLQPIKSVEVKELLSRMIGLLNTIETKNLAMKSFLYDLRIDFKSADEIYTALAPWQKNLWLVRSIRYQLDEVEKGLSLLDNSMAQQNSSELQQNAGRIKAIYEKLLKLSS